MKNIKRFHVEVDFDIDFDVTGEEEALNTNTAVLLAVRNSICLIRPVIGKGIKPPVYWKVNNASVSSKAPLWVGNEKGMIRS